MLVGLVIAMAAAASSPTPPATDFGVREIGAPSGAPSSSAPVSVYPIFNGRSAAKGGSQRGARPVNIPAIVAIGSAWGRVTSTYRSPEHNRRVGGVRNSYHLRGRAIDIARRPGVSHSAIAAAYRNAGYQLAESLDEGDHSHFAFGPAERRSATVLAASSSTGTSASGTQWRIVAAPR